MAMMGLSLRSSMVGGLFDAEVVFTQNSLVFWADMLRNCQAALSNAHLHGCAAMRLHMDGNDGLLTPLERPEHS